jgi:hypothetical protein
LRGVYPWQGAFEWHYKIGAERVESRGEEKLGCMESWTTCHCNGRNCQDLKVYENQKYHFQAIVTDCLAVLRPNGIAVIDESLRFFIILETKVPKGVERDPRGGHV